MLPRAGRATASGDRAGLPRRSGRRLLRYLYGPGRHNEHENPHLVAAWDLDTPAELTTLEPPVLAGEGARAVRDFGPMSGSMELATALRAPSTSAAVVAKQVWHCPLRVAPGDRALTDAEWSEVARDVMHRTGIAERDDAGGCRWVAVRHDKHSVHLVAVLARQDGRSVRLSNDYRRVREACLAAEKRYGLIGTAPADRTAATHVTRAEVEKVRRTAGHEAVPDRTWLRERVQLIAAWADTSTSFLDELRRSGVEVRERKDASGMLTGYAVARPGSEGKPVFYGGGKLAPDLTLPRLQAGWTRCSPTRSGASAEKFDVGRAAAAVSGAARLVRQQSGSGEPAAADVVAASGDLLRAAAWVAEGAAGGGLTRAARQYDRAARESGGAARRTTAQGSALRDVARALLATPYNRRGSAGDWAKLVLQLHDLVVSVAELRRAQQRTAQAVAARRTANHLDAAARAAARSALPAWAAQLGSPRATPPTASPAARRPALPPPTARGTGRSR
ncbi:MAG: mobilization protein [Frankiales bacterium]|nr:mobilization protein [Frankiales bacterium]